MTSEEMTHCDADLTAIDYELPFPAMDAALAYYARNRAVIDARLTLHRAYFEALA